jgi:hypothetical protein
VVILLLILAGLPFREDAATIIPPAPVRPPAPARAGTRPPGRVAAMLAAAVLAGAMALGPAVAAAIDAGAPHAASVALPAFVAGPGCTALPGGAAGVQHFVCDGLRLTATIRAFPPRANPGALQRARRAATGEDLAEETVLDHLTGTRVRPASWQLAETQQPDRSTASAVWIDADPTLEGLRGRLRQARNGLFGAAFAPVLVAVGIDDVTDPRRRRQARQVIGDFLDAQGDLQAVAVALARAAAAAQ